jgi:hypothetical protein
MAPPQEQAPVADVTGTPRPKTADGLDPDSYTAHRLVGDVCVTVSIASDSGSNMHPRNISISPREGAL